MKPEHQEKLQAWVDGEVTQTEAREIGAWVETDPGAQALRNNLLAFSRLLRDNEPTHAVPESREFYWSRIRQGIEAAEHAGAVASAPAAKPLASLRWLAWLLPVGAAALAAFLVFDPATPTSPPNPLARAASEGHADGPAMTDHEVDGPCTEVTLMTFYSSQDTTTVVWLGQLDFL